MKKRIVASLLSLCMVLTLLPVTAFAEDPETGGGGDTPTAVTLDATKFVLAAESAASQVYDGTAKSVSLTYSDESNPNLNVTGITVTYKQNDSNVQSPTNVGTYNIWASVEAAADGSYAKFEAADTGKTLEIAKATPTISVAVSGGAEAKVTVGGNLTVVASTTATYVTSGTYTYSSSDDTKATVNSSTGEVTGVAAGEATITATLTGTDNYNQATATVKITVEEKPADPVDLPEGSFAFTAPTNVTYDGKTETTPAVTYKNNITEAQAGKITVKYYKDETEVAKPKDAGTYSVKVTTEGGSAYKAVTTAVEVGTFEIKKATVTAELKILGTAEVGQTLTADLQLNPILEGFTPNIVWSDQAGSNTTYTVSKNDIGKEITVTVTVPPSDNYTVSGTLTAKTAAVPKLDFNGKVTISSSTDTVEKDTVLTASVTGVDEGDVIYSWSGKGGASTTKTYTVVEGDDTITVTVSGNPQYYKEGSATASVKVGSTGITPTLGSVSITKPYDGNTTVPKETLDAIKQAITFKKGTDEAVTDVEFNVNAVYDTANAGANKTVTVTITLTGDSYVLKQSSVTSNTAEITKVDGSVSPTSDSVTVKVGATTVFTFTTDGTVSATSTDETKATAEAVNNTVIIKGVAEGETTVKISAATGTNYNAVAEKTITVKVEKASSGGGGGGSTGGGGYGGGGGGGTGGTTSDPTTSGGTTSSTVTTTTSGGNATANVSSTTANKLVSQAVENKSDNVTVKVEAGSNVNSVTTQIPASAVDTLAKGSNASLTVDTPVADVVIPNSTLATLGSSSGTVTVKAAVASDKSLTVNVQKNGQDVGALPAPIKVSTPVSETGSGVVAVLVNADGTETVLPKSTLNNGEMSLLLETGSATVKFENRAKDFTDVDGHWASNAIDFVSSHGLFQGVTTTTFGASTDTSRAMMVTVLHRLESEPAASGVSFDDVPTGSYYAEAAAWAADLGITQGNGNGFDGDADISREMMVTMLYRYVQKTAPGTGSMGSYAGMTGSNQVSSWAAEAMNWAVGSGLIQGDAKGLRPGDSTSRAEMAAVMQRFVGLLTK